MKHDYTHATTAELKEIIDSQTTFDGRLVPDMAESYKVSAVVEELIRRSDLYDNTTVCQCADAFTKY